MSSVDPYVVIEAIVAFAATNIDDFFLLAIFFARARVHDNMENKNVCLGQILGFTLLCCLSLIGIAAGVFIPHGYVGLLGFLPFLIGFKKLIVIIRENILPKFRTQIQQTQLQQQHQNVHRSSQSSISTAGVHRYHNHNDSRSRHREDTAELQTVPEDAEMPTQQSDAVSLPITTAASLDRVTSQSQVQSEPASSEDIVILPSGRFRKCLGNCLHTSSLEVAIITIANGGDNIGVYVPLFATASAGAIITILIMFYLCLACWLIASYLLVNHKYLAEFVSEYGAYFVPFFLMGLGMYILWGSILITG